MVAPKQDIYVDTFSFQRSLCVQVPKTAVTGRKKKCNLLASVAFYTLMNLGLQRVSASSIFNRQISLPLELSEIVSSFLYNPFMPAF